MEETNTTGEFIVSKADVLVLNKNYHLILTVENFLGETHTLEEQYVYECLPPEIVSATYSNDYTQIIVEFSKNVSNLSSFLKNHMDEVESFEFNGSTLTLDLKQNFNLFISDVFPANRLETDYCLVDKEVELTIEEPVNLFEPSPLLNINDLPEVLEISAALSSSGYAIKPDLSYTMIIRDNDGFE